MLQQVRIGDDCYIANVHAELRNLIIGSNTVILNVGRIVCNGESSFGNGHEIAVLNEAGGRELKITAETSAQIAYLTVFYRDDAELVKRLHAMADAFSRSVKSSMASIGDNVVIMNCTELVNVKIGDGAILNGVHALTEGTVDSSREAPTSVGYGVIAEHFIMQKGCSVKDGALVYSTLIGEGCQVGKQLSSENSVFFANSEGFHSEICSVFAGPYSVTHHRSTLLIAGYFSFYNAGSGSNQSNHMYKLGPVHQGILERGCKTGSSSYLLWPSRVGAFTAIIGKHYANFDSSDFPFSYIADNDGKSTMIPGMNFFTTGTFRDGLKWPDRDRRKSSKKLDLIIFDVLSPYTIQKMLNGLQILKTLSETTAKEQEWVVIRGIHVKRLLLKTCMRYYHLAIDKYFGDVLIGRVEKESPKHIRELFINQSEVDDEWIDVCGLICTKRRLATLIADIRSGTIKTHEHLYREFEKIYQAYKQDEWNWFLRTYQKVYQRDLADESAENLLRFLDSWKEASSKLLNMVAQDSKKEFEGNVKIGFGIDGNPDADFESVRGLYDKNSFVKKLNQGIEEINRKYEKIKKVIQ